MCFPVTGVKGKQLPAANEQAIFFILNFEMKVYNVILIIRIYNVI